MEIDEKYIDHLWQFPDYKKYRAFRLIAGISSLQVCRATGLSRATIWRFEKGSDINLNSLKKLNEYYNILIKDLKKDDGRYF